MVGGMILISIFVAIVALLLLLCKQKIIRKLRLRRNPADPGQEKMEQTYSIEDDRIYESITSFDGCTVIPYIPEEKGRYEAFSQLTLAREQLNQHPPESVQQEDISGLPTNEGQEVASTQLNVQKGPCAPRSKSILVLAPMDKKSQVPAENNTPDNKTAVIIDCSYEHLWEKLVFPCPTCKTEPIDPNLAQTMLFNSQEDESAPEGNVQENLDFRSTLLLEREQLVKEIEKHTSSAPNSPTGCVSTSSDETNEGTIIMETNIAYSMPPQQANPTNSTSIKEHT